MKILQVMAGAKHGGAETACIDMCIALHEAGEVIEVATRWNEIRVPRLQESGIPVHTLPFGGKLDIYTPWRLAVIIKQFQPQIVQTWLARAARKLPKKTRAYNQYLNVSRLGGYYKRKNFKRSDYFTTITPDIRRHLIDLGVQADHVRHINNFAETEEVAAPLNRADYGIPDDATLILGLGRLHTAKAFDTLIKAVAEVKEAYLWIAGEGPERGNLETLIAALGVDDRVKLLGWRSDRAALFQASDMCFFSSRYEPFGTVFVQAWAQQTPLITTTADGPRQFVRHEEDGLIVEIDDHGAFVAAIRRVMAEPDLRAKMVENGLKRYQNEFTKAQTVADYLGFYHEILEREAIDWRG